jgi:hypothetical protein
MPIFDPSVIPLSESDLPTPAFIAEVNNVIDRLRATHIPLLPLGIGVDRTANMIRTYMHAHLRRCLEFVDAGYAEYRAGRSLVTEACARTTYENVASFCDFADTIVPLVRAGDQQKIHQYLDNAAFSTRIPSFLEKHGNDLSAKNILTQIDKMKKRYPGFREAYDHLSDFVHPNALGAIVHFVSIDNGVATFHDTGRNDGWAISGLIAGCFMLAFVEVAISQVEQAIEGMLKAASDGASPLSEA